MRLRTAVVVSVVPCSAVRVFFGVGLRAVSRDMRDGERSHTCGCGSRIRLGSQRRIHRRSQTASSGCIDTTVVCMSRMPGGCTECYMEC